ncbi:hypothetical protein BELL_0464g00030 [Botrytis elliptica]|uniref:Apple domain-containing protein n=1 Tax=Botrytis elliptica TaxID=278938 RepID=A0A4Z1JM62_9HELO|nr:hypothetical protein EAE99_010756 [Botrytis elliptica]TGO72352.1 hypothetical protein BELL_0464g00030 [Botrytis elliptica]
MKLLYAATALYLLALLLYTIQLRERIFYFDYNTHNQDSIISISTYHPGELITVTPPPTVTTTTSLSVVTSTQIGGATQTVTSNVISTGTVIQTTILFETTEVGPTVTITAAQPTLTVPASSGFLPLANDPYVIANGGAGGATKKRRDANIHSEVSIWMTNDQEINSLTRNTTSKPTSSNNRRYPYHHPHQAANPELADSSAPDPKDFDIKVKPKRWWFDSWWKGTRYPSSVYCREIVRVTQTQIITLQSQGGVTTTLPPEVATSVILSTSTQVITSASATTTTTVVQIENVTSITTEKDVITRSSPTTTTAFPPQATLYDMCQENNIVATVGGATIDYSLPSYGESSLQFHWIYIADPYVKPYNCCAICAQSSTCVGYYYNTDTTANPGPAVTCFTHEATDGVCDPSGLRYVFRADPKRNTLSSDIVGNGNCGKGQLDNGARPMLDGKS